MSKKIDRHCIVCGKMFEGPMYIMDRHIVESNRERNTRERMLMPPQRTPHPLPFGWQRERDT